MFVPKGYLPLSAVVDGEAAQKDPEAMAAEKPKIVASLEQALRAAEVRNAAKASIKGAPGTLSSGVGASPTTQPEPRPATPEQIEEARDAIAGWRAIEARKAAALDGARSHLRQALGDGDLAAVVLTEAGSLASVPVERWRTVEGIRAIKSGHLERSFPHWIGGAVLVEQAAFRAWMTPKPDRAPRARPSQIECDRWVFEEYRKAAEAGSKLKRDEAFARNRARSVPFSDDQMEDAIRRVPDSLRRQRGEKDWAPAEPPKAEPTKRAR